MLKGGSLMLFKNANIFVNGKFQYGAFRVED